MSVMAAYRNGAGGAICPIVSGLQAPPASSLGHDSNHSTRFLSLRPVKLCSPPSSQRKFTCHTSNVRDLYGCRSAVSRSGNRQRAGCHVHPAVVAAAAAAAVHLTARWRPPHSSVVRATNHDGAAAEVASADVPMDGDSKSDDFLPVLEFDREVPAENKHRSLSDGEEGSRLGKGEGVEEAEEGSSKNWWGGLRKDVQQSDVDVVKEFEIWNIDREPEEVEVSGAAKSGSEEQASMVASESFTIGAKEPVYQVLEVNALGSVQKQEVSRRQLLKSSGLRQRDVRRVDPSLWVTNSMPALLVRDNAILVNLGSLRAIATPESVLIFDHQSDGSQAFLETLLQRLRVDSEGSNGPTVPFALEVVEAALISRTQRLENALLDVEPRVMTLLRQLPTRLTATALEELRLSKQALVELGAKSGALRQMLLELLDDSADIRRMTAMGHHCKIRRGTGAYECPTPGDRAMAEEEEQEVEMLLEYYLQRCDFCFGQAEKLLDSAKEMEDSISVNLSSRRLEVSRLELLLQVGTFAAALGALVAGIFGMNLRSKLEDQAVAFWLLTSGIIFGGVALFIVMYLYLKRRKIL